MRKILVYSHDTFGLGNIRRMLAICEHLLETLPDVSILLITGSPVIHSFRLTERLDYIKLPSLSRTERDGYAAKYLGTPLDETLRLRSNLILQAVSSFQPDVILVDKKPLGVKRELHAALQYARTHLPATKPVLILRDILDSPAATTETWTKNQYSAAIEQFYDRVLVLGSPEIFDPVREYALPPQVAARLYCTGYTRRAAANQSAAALRQELGVAAGERLILVTPGGGQDGAQLIETYVAGLALRPANHATRSLIVTGPELLPERRATICSAAADYPDVRVVEFTNDLLSYIAAADLVVAMGGYNTVCEILSAQKPAVIVPRVKPVQEQLIRVERMAGRGWFAALHPDQLTPRRLMDAVAEQLGEAGTAAAASRAIDLEALPRIAAHVQALLPDAHLTVPSRAHVATRRRASMLRYRSVLAWRWTE